MTNIQRSEMDKNHFEYIIWAAVSVRMVAIQGMRENVLFTPSPTASALYPAAISAPLEKKWRAAASACRA